MSREVLVVHWESMMLYDDPSLKFGVAPPSVFAFGLRNRLRSQSRDQRPVTPWNQDTGRCSTLRALLPKRSVVGGNENVARNERHRWGFDSDVSPIERSGLEGVNAGGVGIPKMECARAPGWEAAALRLFRYNLFGEQGDEQGVVFAPSFVLVLGSEMVFGALPLLQMRNGDAGRRNATRLVHVKLIPARDGVRRNPVDFHSCSPFPRVRAKPLGWSQVGTHLP